MQSLKAFLRKDLERTRTRWKGALDMLRARPKIDESVYEDLESALLAADVGVAATQSLVERLRKAQRDRRLEDAGELESEGEPDLAHDSSTNALISRYRRARSG